VFYNFVYALLSYPVGLLSDKIGKRRIYVLGLLVFSAVYLGFAFNQNMYLVWILFALYGFYSAASEGVAKAWVSDLTGDRFRGSAIGLLNMLTSFSIMLGSVAAGILWDLYGASLPFMLSSAASLVIALLLMLLSKKGKI
jgi:MFS family permease